MAEVPKFLFDLFELELQRLRLELLKQVASEFDMDYDTLVERIMPKVRVVPNTEVKVQITKPRLSVAADSEQRCTARIWNRGKGGQCSRKQKEGDVKLCTQHLKEYCMEKTLRHGWFHEPPPKEVFTPAKKEKALYK